MLSTVAALLCLVASVCAAATPTIIATGSEPHVQLAAKEVARYYYLVYGDLPTTITTTGSSTSSSSPIVDIFSSEQEERDLIVVTELTPAIGYLIGVNPKESSLDFHTIRTLDVHGRRLHIITGMTPTATLYAAYRFAHAIGVRFFLKGDFIPSAHRATDDDDKKSIPHLHEDSTPTFELRGLQPFHDFFEGPDWWDVDQYKSVLAQMTKLRMNFIGFHTCNNRDKLRYHLH